MAWWAVLLIGVGALIVGAIIGFFVARGIMKKYIQKNPPVNEKMIREMFRQMGRTPSERQVREVMRSMDTAKNDTPKKK
ncbi:MAG: YneF family protein [Acholeplasmatales bacterium]|jgi:uncharacterized protein YneF (UPF0154 family)|nr:YneF family protein [Acholeplasmatales bacterium]